jgi:hypothetical protein
MREESGARVEREHHRLGLVRSEMEWIRNIPTEIPLKGVAPG